MKNLTCFIANSVIFISILKESFCFFFNLQKFKKVQEKKFEFLIKKNKNTAFLKTFLPGPDKKPCDMPLTIWEHYQTYVHEMMENKQHLLTHEKVLLLEPTSGTSSPTKYIPYTKSLQKEFNKAIHPWICGLYLNWPSLFCSTQYWSLSPVIKGQDKGLQCMIPIGFENDSQYLGRKSSKIARRIMTVPEEVKNSANFDSWAYLTAFYLLRDKNLGLISIWHPSFLNILIEKIKFHYPSLLIDIENGCPMNRLLPLNSTISMLKKPDQRRALELKLLDINEQSVFTKIWPKLKVISCWADNPDDFSLSELRITFPKTWIQPKGIIATEGIISFPFGKKAGVPAFRSHYLEFIDLRNEKLKLLAELEKGQRYELVITTGGGLYRYRMNDIVLVTDINKQKLPQLQFVCKRDYVSDIRGEKLSIHHVERIRKSAQERWPGILFFMLSPIVENSFVGYTCFLRVQSNVQFPFRELAEFIDVSLKENIHYAYARDLGQLCVPKIFCLHHDPHESIVSYFESTGIKRGDCKILALSRMTLWHKYLNGVFISEL